MCIKVNTTLAQKCSIVKTKTAIYSFYLKKDLRIKLHPNVRPKVRIINDAVHLCFVHIIRINILESFIISKHF